MQKDRFYAYFVVLEPGTEPKIKKAAEALTVEECAKLAQTKLDELDGDAVIYIWHADLGKWLEYDGENELTDVFEEE